MIKKLDSKPGNRRKPLLIASMLFFVQYLPGQTNVFPSSGSVGIGVANPFRTLQVAGYAQNSWLTSYENTGTDGHKMYFGYNDNTSTTYGLWILGGKRVANQVDFGIEHKFFVMGDGKVGIGTALPTEMLSVNGNIRAKKIMVTQSGWPDYVFHTSYKLKPLAELEQFVKKNKHLPGMPSADDVTEKGVNLGETQAILLKKIEELTLYMININKKLDRLEKENSNLRKQLGK